MTPLRVFKIEDTGRAADGRRLAAGPAKIFLGLSLFNVTLALSTAEIRYPAAFLREGSIISLAVWSLAIWGLISTKLWATVPAAFFTILSCLTAPLIPTLPVMAAFSNIIGTILAFVFIAGLVIWIRNSRTKATLT